MNNKLVGLLGPFLGLENLDFEGTVADKLHPPRAPCIL